MTLQQRAKRLLDNVNEDNLTNRQLVSLELIRSFVKLGRNMNPSEFNRLFHIINS